MVKSITTELPLSVEEKKRIREAATIVDSFIWETTEQGDGYWSEVYDALVLISNQKDACDKCGQEIEVDR